MRGRPLWPPAVHRLTTRPPQSNPRGSGPEVLKRERGHVTAATGVAEVAAFGALQRNELRESRIIVMQKIQGNDCETKSSISRHVAMRRCNTSWSTLQWPHNERDGVSHTQITGGSMVCSAVCSDADQKKHQSSASLAFVRGIRR